MAKLRHESIKSGVIQLPSEKLISFDEDGVSEEIPDEEAQLLLAIPEYSIFIPKTKEPKEPKDAKTGEGEKTPADKKP
jgi:hypothetical protein